MASEEAWLAAHRRALSPTRSAGTISVLSGMVAMVPIPVTIVILLVLASGLAMLALVVYGAHQGVKEARALV